MSLVMEQIRELADIIGPRPATTDAESRAADHIEDTMRAYGSTWSGRSSTARVLTAARRSCMDCC